MVVADDWRGRVRKIITAEEMKEFKMSNCNNVGLMDDVTKNCKSGHISIITIVVRGWTSGPPWMEMSRYVTALNLRSPFTPHPAPGTKLFNAAFDARRHE